MAKDKRATRTTYHDMLTYHRTMSISEIIMREYLRLAIDCGMVGLPKAGDEPTSVSIKHKDWTRQTLLERIVEWNNKAAADLSQRREGTDKLDLTIQSVAALKVSKADGGRHGGTARISQAFTHGRSLLAKRLDIDPKELTRILKLPTDPSPASKPRKPAIQWDNLLGDLGFDTSSLPEQSDD